MRRGHLYAGSIAVLVGAGAGVAVGFPNEHCVYSCGLNGKCPVPVGCGTAFDWTGAVVFGLIAFFITLAITLTAASVLASDR